MSGGVNIRCYSSVQQWETCCEKQEEHYLEKWQAVRIIFRPAALILASIWRVYNKTTWCLTRGSPYTKKNHRQKYAGAKRRQTAGPRLAPRLIFKLQMCETNTLHGIREGRTKRVRTPIKSAKPGEWHRWRRLIKSRVCRMRVSRRPPLKFLQFVWNSHRCRRGNSFDTLYFSQSTDTVVKINTLVKVKVRISFFILLK